jgi:hypothetical protein
MSREDFHDHYRHPHGTLGKGIPTFRGYVQSHQIDSPLLGADQARFEAIAEEWFDNVADAIGMPNHPYYVEHVKPDEPNFVDFDNLKVLYTTEDVVVYGPSEDAGTPLALQLLQGMHLERPTTVKLLHFASMEAGCADRTDLAGDLGAVRHVRCRPDSHIHADAPPPFAEVHELWWPTVRAFEQGADRSDTLQQLVASDRGSTTLLAVAERFL